MYEREWIVGQIMEVRARVHPIGEEKKRDMPKN